MGLGFCSRIYPFENCCVPVYDEEIRGFYENLIQTSDICASTATQSTLALQYLFCLACSDQQPRYLIEEGIQTADDDSGSNYTLYSIVVCESLVRLLYPENFDDCGLVIPTARGEDCAGDDTVVPSEYWGSGEEGALNFLNDETGGKPPLFSDDDEVRYRVIVSNRTHLLYPSHDFCRQIDYSNGDQCYKSSGHHIVFPAWLFVLIGAVMVIVS